MVNVHLLFVPQKAMRALKNQGKEDPNKWKAFKDQSKTQWEALHLPGGEAHSFEVRINPENLKNTQVQIRQLKIGGEVNGLELKTANTVYL